MLTIAIIIFLIGLFTLVVSGSLFETNDNTKGVNYVVSALFMIFVSMWIIGEKVYKNGYKHGQIDCTNHKMYYKLKIKVDSTKTWENIDPTQD